MTEEKYREELSEKLREFFGSIYKYKPENSFIEVMIKKIETPEIKTANHFSTVENLLKFIKNLDDSENSDFLFDVNPTRKCIKNSFSKNEDISGGSVLFQDFDFEGIVPDLETFKKEIISKYEIKPNVIVLSGNKGYHLYWFLNKFLSPKEWSLTQKGWFNYCKENISENIDSQVNSLENSLRIPSLIHPKSKKRTEILELNTNFECEVQDFPIIKKEQNIYETKEIESTKLTEEQKIKIKTLFSDYWKEKNRNLLTFGLSGFLRKRNISLEDSSQLIYEISKENDDEEINSRLRTVEETYKKSIKEIAGVSKLSEVLTETEIFKLRETVPISSIINWVLKENPFELVKLKKDGIITFEMIYDFCKENRLIKIKFKDPENPSLDSIKEIKYNQDEVISFFSRLFNPYFTLSDIKETYIYNKNKGIYELLNEDKFCNLVRCLLPLRSTEKDLEYNILFFFKHNENTEREEIDDKRPKNKICLENCVLNLKTFEREDFNSKNIFFSKIPVEYNPEAKCLKIESFIKNLELEINDEVNEELGLYEIFGDFLRDGVPMKKMSIGFGPSDSGKSKLIELMINFLGKGNCISMPFQDLSKDRNYSKGELEFKKLCYFADISSEELKDMSFIKSITGGDIVRGRVIFKRAFEYIYNGKLFYTCNVLPIISEDTDAIWNRLLLFHFHKIIKKEDQDPFIINKISTKEELSGLLNKAIEGLERLNKNKRFSNDRRKEEIRKLYLLNSDSVYSFLTNKIEITNNTSEYLIAQDLYFKYLKYCEKNKFSSVKTVEFNRKFSDLTKSEIRKLSRESGKYAFFGFKLKKEKEASFDEFIKDESENLNLQKTNISESKNVNKKVLDSHQQLELLSSIITKLKNDKKENNIENIREEWENSKEKYELCEIETFLEKLNKEGLIYEIKSGFFEVV